MNAARFDIFSDVYKPKDESRPLKKIKEIDGSLYPPCKNVLIQKIRRANFVASMYKNANNPNPIMDNPESHGWVLKNEHYALKWVEGDNIPEDVCAHVDSQYDILTDKNDLNLSILNLQMIQNLRNDVLTGKNKKQINRGYSLHGANCDP